MNNFNNNYFYSFNIVTQVTHIQTVPDVYFESIFPWVEFATVDTEMALLGSPQVADKSFYFHCLLVKDICLHVEAWLSNLTSHMGRVKWWTREYQVTWHCHLWRASQSSMCLLIALRYCKTQVRLKSWKTPWFNLGRMSCWFFFVGPLKAGRIRNWWGIRIVRWNRGWR